MENTKDNNIQIYSPHKFLKLAILALIINLFFFTFIDIFYLIKNLKSYSDLKIEILFLFCEILLCIFVGGISYFILKWQIHVSQEGIDKIKIPLFPFILDFHLRDKIPEKFLWTEVKELKMKFVPFLKNKYSYYVILENGKILPFRYPLIHHGNLLALHIEKMTGKHFEKIGYFKKI